MDISLSKVIPKLMNCKNVGLLLGQLLESNMFNIARLLLVVENMGHKEHKVNDASIKKLYLNTTIQQNQPPVTSNK